MSNSSPECKEKRIALVPVSPGAGTSVMGHVQVVAIMGYFCALSLGACKARLVNDFLGACGMICRKC